jgi:hypothetical protein
MELEPTATTKNVGGGGGGAGASTSTSSSAAAARWSPADDVALKGAPPPSSSPLPCRVMADPLALRSPYARSRAATLRLHFQDLASTIRPRDWYTRHSLYWWLSQHYFPCTRTLFGERTCSLLGLVSQVHRTIISGLATFVEANSVHPAPHTRPRPRRPSARSAHGSMRAPPPRPLRPSPPPAARSGSGADGVDARLSIGHQGGGAGHGQAEAYDRRGQLSAAHGLEALRTLPPPFTPVPVRSSLLSRACLCVDCAFFLSRGVLGGSAVVTEPVGDGGRGTDLPPV